MMYLTLLARPLCLALAMVLLSGCSTTPPDGPGITDLAMTPNPSGRVPLAGVITLGTDRPARITLQVDDGERSWDIRPSDALATSHELMLLGLG